MVKYIKPIIVAATLAATIFLSGCEREFYVPDTTVKDIQSEVMKKMGLNLNPTDFNVWISGSRASNATTAMPVLAPKLDISAYSKEKDYVGKVVVGSRDIPYSTGNYRLQPKDSNDVSLFLGKQLEIQLSSEKADLPSFRRVVYIPTIPTLTFPTLRSGLVNREIALEINWSKDLGYTPASYVAIQGSNNDDSEKSDLIIKEVNDAQGTCTIYPQELSKLKNFELMTIYYFKGYQTDFETSGKKNTVTLIGMSYSHLYFE